MRARGSNVRTLVVIVVLLVLFGVLQIVETTMSKTSLLSSPALHCANPKLPSGFISDPLVIVQRGGAGAVLAPAPTSTPGEETQTSSAYGPDAAATAFVAGKAATATASPVPAAGGTIDVATLQRPDNQLLHLAVANTEADRERGLMCVTGMAPDAGMIFVFERDAPENFWMKDTLIPLDMVFVRSDGTVTSVAANVPASRMDEPDDKVTRRGGAGKYVIELNAGEAARDGIARGVRLRLPQLPRHG